MPPENIGTTAGRRADTRMKIRKRVILSILKKRSKHNIRIVNIFVCVQITDVIKCFNICHRRKRFDNAIQFAVHLYIIKLAHHICVTDAFYNIITVMWVHVTDTIRYARGVFKIK